MELVYLWVEKYKNIENQGFNFSPRFTCEFFPIYEKDADGKEKLIDNCKLEIKPNEHIENFFGKNINVTAIVGENGSGKSNILEMLFGNIISDCNFFYVVSSKTDDKEKGILILYKFDDKLSIYSKEIKIGKSYKLSDINDKKKPITEFSTLFYSTSSYINNISNQGDNITKAQNLAISEKETYLIYKLKSIEYALLMIKNNTNFDKIFELPKYIIIGVKEYEKSDFYEKLHKSIKPPKTFLQKVKIAILCEIYKKRQEEVNQIEIDDKNDDLDAIFNKIIKMKELGGLKDDIDGFIKCAESISKDRTYNVGMQVDIDEIDDKFVNTYHKMLSSAFSLTMDLDILNFSWYPNLSTGQETYLFQFAHLYNAIRKDLSGNLMITIDEGENTLHPNWQKMYIKYIVDFFTENFSNKKLHIIFSSHSPFILSDIPKENVIFLEKDEKTDNCINVTDKTNIETFGANIHTLLSNGFFMKDGLMGEFAKGKINKIIEFHKKVEQQKEDKIKKEELKTEYEAKKKEFWHIQSIIGEDYLKQVIKNHLIEIEKLLLGRDEAKNAEITRLQKQIELLESKDA
ncbi:MAG: AAA family ATPase [Sulfurimonas sp.]|nr:AAA family ATPase [Sulfurimonas sp.]